MNQPDQIVLLESLARELGWDTFTAEDSDCIFSIWVGAAPKRRGQKNYHIGYIGSMRIAKDLDLGNVQRTVKHSMINTVLALVEKRAYFLAELYESAEQTILLLNCTKNEHPEVPETLKNHEFSRVDGYGIMGCKQLPLHIFPNPKKKLPRIDSIICLDSETPAETVERLSPGEATIELVQRSNQRNVGPMPIMSQATKLVADRPSFRVNPDSLNLILSQR